MYCMTNRSAITLIKRLRAAGVTVLTPEMATENPDSNGNGHTQFAGLAKNYWESEEDVVGAGDYYTRIKVDGIIGIMAFACGPDSLMMNLVQRQAHSAGIPYMSLTVEEHTAEAGIITRIEVIPGYDTQGKEEERTMRITFPHIGNAYIAVKAMLDPLGVDYCSAAEVQQEDFIAGHQVLSRRGLHSVQA